MKLIILSMFIVIVSSEECEFADFDPQTVVAVMVKDQYKCPGILIEKKYVVAPLSCVGQSAPFLLRFIQFDEVHPLKKAKDIPSDWWVLPMIGTHNDATKPIVQEDASFTTEELNKQLAAFTTDAIKEIEDGMDAYTLVINKRKLQDPCRNSRIVDTLAAKFPLQGYKRSEAIKKGLETIRPGTITERKLIQDVEDQIHDVVYEVTSLAKKLEGKTFHSIKNLLSAFPDWEPDFFVMQFPGPICPYFFAADIAKGIICQQKVTTWDALEKNIRESERALNQTLSQDRKKRSSQNFYKSFFPAEDDSSSISPDPPTSPRIVKTNTTDNDMNEIMMLASYVTVWHETLMNIGVLSWNILNRHKEPSVGDQVEILVRSAQIWLFKAISNTYEVVIGTENITRPLMAMRISATVFQGDECLLEDNAKLAYCLQITCPQHIMKFIHLIGSPVVYRKKPVAFITHLSGDCFDESGLTVVAAKLHNAFEVLKRRYLH